MKIKDKITQWVVKYCIERHRKLQDTTKPKTGYGYPLISDSYDVFVYPSEKDRTGNEYFSVVGVADDNITAEWFGTQGFSSAALKTNIVSWDLIFNAEDIVIRKIYKGCFSDGQSLSGNVQRQTTLIGFLKMQITPIFVSRLLKTIANFVAALSKCPTIETDNCKDVIRNFIYKTNTSAFSVNDIISLTYTPRQVRIHHNTLYSMMTIILDNLVSSGDLNTKNNKYTLGKMPMFKVRTKTNTIIKYIISQLPGVIATVLAAASILAAIGSFNSLGNLADTRIADYIHIEKKN